MEMGTTELYYVATALAGVAAVYFLFFRKKNSNNDNILSAAEMDKLLQTRPQGGALPSSPSAVYSNFVEKLKRTNKNIVVFYGSQTGTAEEFATRLVKSATKYGMKGLACDPEDVDDWEVLKELPNQVERNIAVFCMATYGEGEPTDNALELYNWLKETDIDLSGLNYCVFGLGNRTYENYNSMGTLFDDRLAKLGAERICPLGLGDDDQNIEDDFVQWQENFWTTICDKFSVESSSAFSSVRQFELRKFETTPERVFSGEPARYQSFEKQRPPFEAKNPFLGTIQVQKKINSNEDRYMMHIEVETTGSRMRYDAGDHIAVLPKNQSDLVEKLGSRIGIDLEDLFSLVNTDPDDSKKHPFPCPTSYRVAFSHYLDITSHPTTHMCRELAEYAESEEEKNFLILLSSNTPEGKEKYMSWIKADNRFITDVLLDLPSVKVSPDHLCELLPRLQVRYYSISSSAKVYPSNVHITAVLVNYVTSIQREVKGVCTQYLLDSAESEEKKLACYIRKSQFRLPMKSTVPIIMIGPGTGFAPFRGFLQEKAWQKEQDKPLGEVVLFYGCRRQDEDYIYREEVEDWLEKGIITNLFTAFSRDQDQKVYVQHRLAENSELIWGLIKKGAHIYICGDAKNMAREVYSCFEDIISKFGEMTREQATQYLKSMSNKGRYSADVWS